MDFEKTTVYITLKDVMNYPCSEHSSRRVLIWCKILSKDFSVSECINHNNAIPFTVSAHTGSAAETISNTKFQFKLTIWLNIMR